MAPRIAATVVLLRDGAGGLEVLMLRRHGHSSVLGGAHVFPGGKVDPEDADPRALERLAAPLSMLSASLGDPDLLPAEAAAFFVAACRETLEEAGILLAERASAADFETARIAARSGDPFVEVIERLGLRLDWANIVPWSRWITPIAPTLFRGRFDARFFLSMVPDGQQVLHDDFEATGSFWLLPRAALEQYWSGEIELAPAQIMSLAALARHSSVDDAIAAARSRRPPVIQPESFSDGELAGVAFPGDARHPLADPALPGPSFLVYRNGRFEPADGIAALLA